MSTAEFTSAVLALPPEERAAIATRLLESLDMLGRPLEPDEWHRVWTAEIERRMRALESEPRFPADAVFDELERELLGRRAR